MSVGSLSVAENISFHFVLPKGPLSDEDFQTSITGHQGGILRERQGSLRSSVFMALWDVQSGSWANEYYFGSAPRKACTLNSSYARPPLFLSLLARWGFLHASRSSVTLPSQVCHIQVTWL